MFTGLILEVGRVEKITQAGEYARIRVYCPHIRSELKLGDSVAINGACQTVAELHSKSAEFDTLAESLAKTNLGNLKTGDAVNLETSVTPSTPMGGHFVQGHVNGTGVITAIDNQPNNIYMWIQLPAPLLRLCVAEGSIAVDGISLTTARVTDNEVAVNLIPHTMKHTNLGTRTIGDHVNIETDIIARYVERLLGQAGSDEKQNTSSLTAQRLQRLGYNI